MFLHLGGIVVTDFRKIIAILNVEESFSCESAQGKLYGKKIEDISGGKPKSAVVTDDRIIITPISSLTLGRRTKQITA